MEQLNERKSMMFWLVTKIYPGSFRDELIVRLNFFNLGFVEKTSH